MKTVRSPLLAMLILSTAATALDARQSGQVPARERSFGERTVAVFTVGRARG